MATDMLPMRELLELALGSPDDGCVNLKMLHAFLRQLMISAKCENVNVNLKDFTGLREGGEAEMGAAALVQAAVAKGGNAGDAVQDMWEYIKLKKQVEANRKGIDNLFDMAGKIVDAVGDDRIVTWGGLGEALTGFEPDRTEKLVRQTVNGLDRAKQYYKDPTKQTQIEKTKAKVLDKFERISTGVSRKSSYAPNMARTEEEDDEEEERRGGVKGAGRDEEKGTKESSEGNSVTAMTLTESSSEGLDVDDEDFAEKTVNTLGKVAMLHGANEARLAAVDEQLQNLLKFKKTVSYMLQDLDIKSLNDKIGLLNGSDVKNLNDLLMQLTQSGGMEQLQKLIKSINKGDVDERQRMLDMQEKLLALEMDGMLGGLGGKNGKLGADGLSGGLGADGLGADGMGLDGVSGMSAAEANARMRSGLATQARKMGMAERKIDRVSEELKSAKQELKNMMELMADLMKDVQAGKETEQKVNELKEMASKLQEELGKQNELIMSMTEAISEYGAALEMLKKQVRHLQEYKADKSWVKKELALKADLALLENYITKEDFEDCLEDIGRTLGDVQSAQSSLHRLFDWEMKKLLDELMKKMTVDDFESFKKNVGEGFDQLKRRMDWIAGVAGGEEEAAGFKINKFHCVSCDRPVHALARQQPAPTVPALPGLNISKSANPYRVLETAKTRKIANKNQNNAKGPLPDHKSSSYGKAVLETETQWQKRRDFCLNRKYGKPDPILADRRDIFDMNTSGYYRVFSADDCVDVWRQDRKCGGDFTVVHPWQKRLKDNAEADDAIILKENAPASNSTETQSQNNKNNNQGEVAAVEASDSDTDEATGVVAIPVHVADLNVDIRGVSKMYYMGDAGDISVDIPPPSPAPPASSPIAPPASSPPASPQALPASTSTTLPPIQPSNGNEEVSGGASTNAEMTRMEPNRERQRKFMARRLVS